MNPHHPDSRADAADDAGVRIFLQTVREMRGITGRIFFPSGARPSSVDAHAGKIEHLERQWKALARDFARG